MPNSRLSQILRAIFALAAITLSLAGSSQSQTFTSLVSFNGTDGAIPLFGSLVQGTNGNYYGTTQFGGIGIQGHGVVYEVTPAGKLTDIYRFCSLSGCADGSSPWTPPVLGTDGNLYGTTTVGGNSTHSGTIYKLTPKGNLTTLYSFCPTRPCNDGQYPTGLMQARNGNFYGVTPNGGPTGNGTIFEITPAGQFKVLYSFCPQFNCADGGQTQSAPIQASNGNFYGTTFHGGPNSNGVVYEITPAGQYKVIHNFCAQTLCAEGASPEATLVQDASGSFFGTTFYGGAYSYGTVFEITATGAFIVRHSFDNSHGGNPTAALILANDGNLYGMTGYSSAGGGTIFKITRSGAFTLLHRFCTSMGCGKFPVGALLQGTNGRLYGATEDGGPENAGTVFSLSNGLSPLVQTVPTAGKVGRRVIILGNGLTGSTSVTFNGTSAPFTVVSDTEITANVPTGATSGPVKVITPSRTLKSNPIFQVLAN